MANYTRNIKTSLGHDYKVTFPLGAVARTEDEFETELSVELLMNGKLSEKDFRYIAFAGVRTNHELDFYDFLDTIQRKDIDDFLDAYLKASLSSEDFKKLKESQKKIVEQRDLIYKAALDQMEEAAQKELDSVAPEK